MTINYKFPSSEKKEIDFTPGFTAREKKYLSREKKQPEPVSLLEIFIVIMVALTIVGVLGTILFMPRAEAAEEIHDNAYYCKAIAAGEMQVKGATDEMVASLCAEYI